MQLACSLQPAGGSWVSICWGGGLQVAPNHPLSLCEPRANQCIPSLTRLIPTANFRLCVTELASDMLRSVGLSSHFHATKVLDISRFSGGRRESDTGHTAHASAPKFDTD